MSAFSIPTLHVPDKYGRGPYQVAFSREAIKEDYAFCHDIYQRLAKRGWWHGPFLRRSYFDDYCDRGLQDHRKQQTIIMDASGMFLGFVRATHYVNCEKATLNEFVIPPTLAGLNLIGSLCDLVASRAETTGVVQLFTKVGEVPLAGNRNPTYALFNSFGFDLMGREAPPECAVGKRTPMLLFRRVLAGNPPNPSFRPSVYRVPQPRSVKQSGEKTSPSSIAYHFIPANKLSLT